ncbi:MAG TPA: Fe-S-containing protein [Thermoanaerobaculia bacterium]|nr:Fe-S-containing protein [Thermoanaerobaculia bacterium]
MLESFVIVLREGIEAALVVAIVVAALRKAGREDLYGRVALGIALAVAASIAGGIGLRGLAVDEDVFEGFLMLVAAVFVATMMVWIHRTAHRMREHVGTRVSSALGRGGASVFWLTFLLVAREGIEAVLFLSAASLNTDTLAAAAGGAAGLAMAVAFGVAFARGSLRIDLKRFFAVTNFVLGLLLVQLFVGGLHELAEAGLVRVGRTEMAVIGPVVKNNLLFVLALLLVPFFAIATAKRGAVPEGSGPEARLARARDLRERRGLGIAAALSAAILVVLTVSFVRAEAGRKLSPAAAATIAGGEIRIPVASVSDGHLHRFTAEVGGHATRFLVIRSGKEIKTAFDACQICGTEGYNEVGANVVCLHCDANMNIPTIGKPGGCNPMPLPSRVEGDAVVIREADLAAESGQFPASR